MSCTVRRWAGAVIAAVALGIFFGAIALPAGAHGFSSVVYADLSSGGPGHVRARLGLEYDLLVVSAADTEKDDPLFRAGDGAFKNGDAKEQVTALEAHAAPIRAYVTKRFAVTAKTASCTPVQDGGFTIDQRDGVPYAFMVLDYRCPETAVHEVRSGLFPDSEGYVKGTKTIVSYDLDLTKGSAALDDQRPEFSTQQRWTARFWEFFQLGAEHLLTGLDHILFLLALIAGSRRPREIVLAATTFTLAHSVTFILAALNVVHVPAWFVEPVIALSIAVVASWHLWRSWRQGPLAAELQTTGRSHLSLDRAGWSRLGVVFCFGLVHGLGFAGALGIDQPFSWTLLWSLLVFNVGIETVQLSIIVIIFPLLVLLRRRSPVMGRWTTAAVSAVVAVMGLIWFVQRAFGL
jgi:hypothetical protein